MSFYCYKIKSSFIKVDSHNFYKRPKIEKYGFVPMMEEDGTTWANGWAISISLGRNTKIAQFVYKFIERIYKTDEDSKKTLLEEGYEFDQDGKLVENEKSNEPVNTQLYVLATGKDRGVLTIGVSGLYTFVDAEVIQDAVPEIVSALEEDKAIYLKKL